jgi:hypothetical protein
MTTQATEIVQTADAFKEIIGTVNKDPRVIAAVNIAQRVNNALTIYKSRSSLKGIQKQESHQAKVRMIKRLLMKRYADQKAKISQKMNEEKKKKGTLSETREKKFTEYASFCFLLEGVRLGVGNVPVLDAANIVGTGLLTCAEKNKIERLQTEEAKEKSHWELVKSRCRQLQYGLIITSKVVFLVSSAAFAIIPAAEPASGNINAFASKTQNIATVIGVTLAAVSAYENRKHITNAVSHVGKYIYSCFDTSKHE